MIHLKFVILYKLIIPEKQVTHTMNVCGVEAVPTISRHRQLELVRMGCGSSSEDSVEGIEDNREAGDVDSIMIEAKHEDTKDENFPTAPPLPGTIEEPDHPMDIRRSKLPPIKHVARNH